MANDPYWNNVVLAMHMDDIGLTDLKGRAVTLNGNATRSAVQSKFGGYSAAFDGAGDYLTTPHSADFAFGAGDFTVEAFIYPTNSTTESAIFAKWSTAATTNEAFFLGIRANGIVVMLLSTSGTYNASYDFASATGAVTYNTWNHVAYCRSGSTIRMFVNGALVKEGAFVTSTLFASTLAESVGACANAATPYTGYIDDLRITKGVARYTANFTVPTEAFPNTPPQLLGTVRDMNSNLVARTVRSYRRSDGMLAGTTVSSGVDGTFSVNAYDGSAHYVVCLDDGTPDENALILDNITPV